MRQVQSSHYTIAIRNNGQEECSLYFAKCEKQVAESCLHIIHLGRGIKNGWKCWSHACSLWIPTSLNKKGLWACDTFYQRYRAMQPSTSLSPREGVSFPLSGSVCALVLLKHGVSMTFKHTPSFQYFRLLRGEGGIGVLPSIVDSSRKERSVCRPIAQSAVRDIGGTCQP